MQLAVPVDPFTGFPLPSVAQARITRYRDAEREFRLVLHELAGTTEGSHPGDRRMAKAFDRLDELGLWVVAGILDH
jgi:hypothetical protein